MRCHFAVGRRVSLSNHGTFASSIHFTTSFANQSIRFTPGCCRDSFSAPHTTPHPCPCTEGFNNLPNIPCSTCPTFCCQSSTPSATQLLVGSVGGSPATIFCSLRFF